MIENELKKLKIFDSSNLMAKVILNKKVHKIIYNFSQCTNILKRLLVLVVAITFITINSKDYLMRELIL